MPVPRPRTLNDLSQFGAPAKPATSKHPLALELHGLLPPRFLEQISFDRLKDLPRYLKALLTRFERAALNPQKDAERAAQLAPYAQVVAGFAAKPSSVPEVHAMQEEFRWRVEEFKVSLFAQELGTAVPISAKRLDLKLEEFTPCIRPTIDKDQMGERMPVRCPTRRSYEISHLDFLSLIVLVAIRSGVECHGPHGRHADRL